MNIDRNEAQRIINNIMRDNLAFSMAPLYFPKKEVIDPRVVVGLDTAKAGGDETAFFFYDDQMLGSMPRIKANYSFFRHPIKWLRQRKARRIMQLYLDKKYPEMRGEIERMAREVMLYGTTYYRKKP